jgi:hypothetical protein
MSADDRLRVGTAGLDRMDSRHVRNLATRVPNEVGVSSSRDWLGLLLVESLEQQQTCLS